MELTPAIFAIAVLFALLCQYMSISIGIGYGTVMTPLLLAIGFSPLQIIPAVLLSQLVGGTIGGLSHYKAGNIALAFRQDDRPVKGQPRRLNYLPRSTDAQVILVLAVFGIIGVIAGVFLAVNIPQVALETYIGIVVLAMGMMIVLKLSYKGHSSWIVFIILGFVSAFNKGVSGAGYVPLVMGGQIIGGRTVKSSVGNTSVAVAIVCAVGFISYLLVDGNIYWALAIAMTIGSIIAAPFAAVTVRKVNAERLRFITGFAIVALGILILTRTYIY